METMKTWGLRHVRDNGLERERWKHRLGRSKQRNASMRVHAKQRS